MSMHCKKAALSLHPNNAKIYVEEGRTVCDTAKISAHRFKPNLLNFQETENLKKAVTTV
jgi:hypothetical protein